MAVVTSVLGLSRSGTADFLIQRVSAVIIGLYALCVFGFFLANPAVSHSDLVAYFTGSVMRMFTTLTVLATAAHAWIGMWTVGTDYIREHYFGRHAAVYRFVYLMACILVIFIYVVWALWIFWRI